MAERGASTDCRCDYCFQELHSMVDPRKLPCHHVFCLPCLMADDRANADFSCPSCQVVHRLLSFKDLPVVEGGAETNREAASLTCDCENCNGQLAVCFCIECNDKICDIHVQTHNSHFGTKHETVPISVYELSPGKYKRVVCNMHGQQLTLACDGGDKLICGSCDSSSSADRCQGDERRSHKFRPLEEFEEEISTYFKPLFTRCTEKMAKIRTLNKMAWTSLDTEQVLCMQRIEMLDTICEQQVKVMREQCEDMKERIRDYLHRLTNQVEEYNTELMDKKEKLEESRNKVHRWLRESHVAEKIQQKQQMTEKLARETKNDLVSVQISAHAVIPRAERQGICIDLVNIPASLTLLTTLGANSSCFAVSHTSNGHLLFSVQRGIQMVKRDRIQSHHKEGAVTTAIAKDHVRYVLYSSRGVCGVDLCLSDLKQKTNLFAFTHVSSTIPYMAISARHIIVTTPSKKRVIIFAFAGNVHQMVTTDAVVWVPYFLPDGHLLASCSPSPSAPTDCVAKYRIEGSNMSVVWKCEGLDNPFGVCTGADGLIYVCSKSNQRIYILSPDGTILRELTHDKLPTHTGQISVCRDELAVPGVADQSVVKFRVNY